MPVLPKLKPRSPSSLPSRSSVKNSFPDRPGIATDTAIMPWIVADKICEEAANYLQSPVPLRFKEHLDAKAERCYARHRQFRKLIRARGNSGRDSLYSFMRHWLYALLHKHHPVLADRVPQSFALGHPLDEVLRNNPVSLNPKRQKASSFS